MSDKTRVDAVQVAPARWAAIHMLRPKDWIKNAFVLAPVIFSGSFLHPGAVQHALVAAVCFCLASSATYVFNDLMDREADRLHPRKRFTRPLAAGLVSPKAAYLMIAALLASTAAIAFFNPRIVSVVVAYLLLQVAYTMKLKHMPVVDLFAIAAGFVLRVYAGSLSVSVGLSFWMFITTLCLALHLAAAKRLEELKSSGPLARTVLQEYSVPVLDYYVNVSAICAVVFYGMFVATVRHSLVMTTVFVVFGVFRYRYAIEKHGAGESPADVLLGDGPLLLCVLGWALSCIYALSVTPL